MIIKIKKFLLEHPFLILLSLGGIILTGLFGFITGAIAGVLLDQLLFRMNKKENNTTSTNQEEIKPLKQIAKEDYLILGITPETPPNEIKKTYHQLASQFHPDLTSDLSPAQRISAEEAFKKIQAAYERIIAQKS